MINNLVDARGPDARCHYAPRGQRSVGPTGAMVVCTARPTSRTLIAT